MIPELNNPDKDVFKKAFPGINCFDINLFTVCNEQVTSSLNFAGSKGVYLLNPGGLGTIECEY